MLETAFSFLYRKGKTVNGSPLNQAHQQFVISFGGQCLHCGRKLTRKNSNTEHIHDRALGGLNSSDNKVIMCISCNHARNATMQEYLGSPSYWQGFPGNWDRVKNYLLWNAVTVDVGHDSGKSFPDVHQIFESKIQNESFRVSPPNSWFGRGDKTELVYRKKPSIWLRFFDKLFGYSPATNVRGSNSDFVGKQTSKINDELIPNQSERNTNDPKKQVLKQNPSVIADEFSGHILSALAGVNEEVKLETFCNIFKYYLVENGLPAQSLKEYAQSFGIPKRRNFLEIIDLYFSETIGYRRETVTSVYIWPKRLEEE